MLWKRVIFLSCTVRYTSIYCKLLIFVISSNFPHQCTDFEQTIENDLVNHWCRNHFLLRGRLRKSQVQTKIDLCKFIKANYTSINLFWFLYDENFLSSARLIFCSDPWFKLPRCRPGRCVAIRLWNRFCEIPYFWITCMIFVYRIILKFILAPIFAIKISWKTFLDTKKSFSKIDFLVTNFNSSRKSLTQTWLNFSEAQSNDIVYSKKTSLTGQRPYRQRRRYLTPKALEYKSSY